MFFRGLLIKSVQPNKKVYYRRHFKIGEWNTGIETGGREAFFYREREMARPQCLSCLYVAQTFSHLVIFEKIIRFEIENLFITRFSPQIVSFVSKQRIGQSESKFNQETPLVWRFFSVTPENTSRLHENARVLITGAASGIGLVLAKSYLEQGARVHICDASLASISSLSKSELKIGATLADISNVDEVGTVFEDVSEQLGGLDILINNAAIAGPTGKLENLDPGEWKKTVDVDLNGQFYCLRKAIPMLCENETASIINIVSSAGVMGYPLRSPYSACKWAMIGITKTLAMELGSQNIRVNAICPGSVDGPRIEGVMEREALDRGIDVGEVRRAYLKQSSMRTFISAEDIANMAIFISSNLGEKISGQILGVDGNTESLAQ